MLPPTVRHAEAGDVPALTRLRTHYVLHTHAAFDTVPPTEEQMSAWLAGYGDGTAHQLLVAADDDRLWGYASSSPYRPTPAFARTVELSVYLDPELRARGVGSALYAELLPRAAQHGARSFVAGVALPNDASLAFHLKHGFVEVGTFHDYAEKWGRPISSTWFQRVVDDGIVVSRSAPVA